MEDWEIILNATSGLALCGICIDGVKSNKKKRPVKQILKCPKECQLQGPTEKAEHLRLEFHSYEDSLQFSNAAETLGLTAAADLIAPIAKLFFDGTSSRSSSSIANAGAVEHCNVEVIYAPIKSFRIKQHHMQLSEEARADVGRILDISQAKEFLNQYHSHLSTGTYHLGAIYFEFTNSAHSAQKSSLATKRSTGLRGGMGLSVGPAATQASLTFQKERGAASGEETLTTEASRSCRAQVLGSPLEALTDKKAFPKLVAEASPSTWAIINSTHSIENLVPIWELVLASGDESLKKPAQLLRMAWQTKVAHLVHEDEDLFKLHQASITSTVVPINDVSQIQGFSDVEVLKANPDKFMKELLQVWELLPYELRPELFKKPGVMQVMHMVVNRDDMKAAREMLGAFIQSSPASCTKVLEKAGVNVAMLFSPQIQPQFPVPTFMITQEELPNKLLQPSQEITSRLDSTTRSFQVPKDCISDANNHPRTLVEDGLKFHGENHKLITSHGKEPVDTNASALMAATDQQQSNSVPIGPGGNEVVRSTLTPQIGPQFTYINDFLTHRLFPQPNKYRNLIDRISHALAPFENQPHKYQIHNESKRSAFEDFKRQSITEDDFWGADDDAAGGSQEEDPVIEKAAAAKAIIHIYENSDFPAQISLLRLLLDQRWGAPLVFTSSSPGDSVPGKVCCFHTMQALNYVLTKTGAQSSPHNLVQATDLLRVVFITSHFNPEHEHMAHQVTKFRFLPFPYNAEDQTMYMQLGMGYLPTSQDLKPYLVVVASGPCITEEQCLRFLNETADVLILQVPHSDLRSTAAGVSTLLTCRNLLRWAIDPSGAPGQHKATKEIWGSSSDVAERISKFLAIKAREVNLSQAGRRNLNDICNAYFEGGSWIDQPNGLEDALEKTQFETLREQLILQSSFLLEAATRFDTLKLGNDNDHIRKKLGECNNEKRKRQKNVGISAKIPIIQFFLKVLQEEDSSVRSISIMKLQNSMQERSQKALVYLSEKVEQAFKRFQNVCTPEASEEYNIWKDQYAAKVVGMEHLWREVCHMFLADPKSYSKLPKLAARHLLDGFPLEILDGDARLFNDLWLKAVLTEAEELIKPSAKSPTRILVLSVLGTQSSGKTTLLNAMFGTHLPTKAGLCTRGVHIQLIKSGWSEYDYILLMDTEGIRSPEQYGEEQYLYHDNRMATFAILPSDACIMVVANEDDSSLKEVLPLVLRAFKGSAAAENSSGRLRSKLFFVYRSVDISEQGELRSNQKKLLEYFVEAERHITKPAADDTNIESRSEIGGGRLGSAATLFQFHVDDQEDLSDVKFLGNHKKESMPPEDVPDPRYGEKILQVRDYLHRRVTQDPNWKPFSVKEFSNYMKLVWSCIWEADFELSFKSSVDLCSFIELQQMLQNPRSMVSKAYVEEFEDLEKRIAYFDNTSTGENTELEWLQFRMVKATINEQSKQVEEILENNRWLITWKAEERQKWKDFLMQQEIWFNMQLRDHKTGVVLFEKLMIECDQKMQQDIIALRELPDEDPKRQISFDTMFSNFLQNAKKKHGPLADRVPAQIESVYSRHKDIFEYKDIFESSDVDEANTLFEDPCVADLKNGVKHSLINAKQYSDDLVEGAITFTSALIEKRPITYDGFRKRRARAHAHVKEFITGQLCVIQQRWDEEHNPAARLEKQRDRFQHFYNNHMNGYDMSNLLLDEFKCVFKDNLESTLEESFVKLSCRSLEKEPWLFNWKIMRGLLDALLLKLLEDEKIDHVLDYASDGALYHRLVMEELIKRNLRSIAKVSLHNFCGSVKDAVTYASNAVARGKSSSKEGVTATFRAKLLEMLRKHIPACTKICVALYRINPEAYKQGEEQIDFVNILTPGLHCMVDDICDSVGKRLDEEIGLRDLADMVKKRLISNDNQTFRARCEAACPLCGVTCFLPAYHDTSHDTLHQPQGLKGTCEDSKQLSEKTCAEHYRDDASFNLDSQQSEKDHKAYWRMNSYHHFNSGLLQCSRPSSATQTSKMQPYRQFDKAYPDWKNPSISHDARFPLTCKVRQCLFFHCQQQLVMKKYPETKKNDNCAHFAHAIAPLRFEIEQDLPEDLRAFIEDNAL